MLKKLVRQICNRYAARAAKHGDLTTAERLWAVAIAYGDNSPETHRKLGELYLQSGSYERAGAHWLRVAELEPGAAPFLQLAMIHHRQGQLADAERQYEAVLRIDSGNFDALHLMGVLRTQQGRCDDALRLLNDALGQNPYSAEAHSNLGIALNETQRHEEAVASYGKAIELKPEFAEAHSNLCLTLNTLKRHEQAIASGREALELNPGLAEAHYNIGNALYALDRREEAVASYRSALEIKPDDVEAHSNLGLALYDLNRQAEAIAHYDRALALKSDFAAAQWNRGLAHLALGDLTNGWEAYEWRWRAKVTAPLQDFARPLWPADADPRGKTVLLHADQGFGDAIQFARYAPLLAAKGARVVLQVPPALKELMTSLAGVDLVVARGAALPDFDCHFPLSGLPRAFATTLQSIPASIPYLYAAADKVVKWQALLGERTGLRVGLAWAGNPNHKNDRNRSIALARLLPLLTAPGVGFVSLQKELRDEDAVVLGNLAGFAQFGDRLEDFSDTAAVMSLLDVVISVDSAVAHLAGALGKPAWVLLPFAAEWRWLLERDDSPWYPSSRLFRQPRQGDWDSVLERVRTELLRVSPQPDMR